MAWVVLVVGPGPRFSLSIFLFLLFPLSPFLMEGFLHYITLLS